MEAFINEYVADISSTGVFIRSKDPLPVGTRVNLKFTLILDELHVVEAAGEVVRSLGDRSAWASRFAGRARGGQKLIGRAVKERRERRRSSGSMSSGKRIFDLAQART